MLPRLSECLDFFLAKSVVELSDLSTFLECDLRLDNSISDPLIPDLLFAKSRDDPAAVLPADFVRDLLLDNPPWDHRLDKLMSEPPHGSANLAWPPFLGWSVS